MKTYLSHTLPPPPLPILLSPTYCPLTLPFFPALQPLPPLPYHKPQTRAHTSHLQQGQPRKEPPRPHRSRPPAFSPHPFAAIPSPPAEVADQGLHDEGGDGGGRVAEQAGEGDYCGWVLEGAFGQVGGCSYEYPSCAECGCFLFYFFK